MKNNERDILKVIIPLLLFVLGCGVMYGIIYKYPDALGLSLTRVEKNVTVTDNGIAESVDKVLDAVVIVTTYRDNQLYGSGTGFVYKTEDNKAYILTNNHVIDGASTVTATFTDNKVVETEIVGSDVLSDIAVLSVSKSDAIRVAEIGKSESLKVGDTAFAVGAPLNSAYSWTVTRGIISGKDRMVEVTLSSDSGDYVMKVLQTDAAINAGNSGGPLCNINGEVIGITSLKLVDESVEGMGFAIPIETALEYAEKLEAGKVISQPYLGIAMYNVTDAYYSPKYYNMLNEFGITSGVLVASIEKNSPADKAGLKADDVIIKLNKEDISSVGFLRYYLYNYDVGDTVELTIMRNGKEKNIKITLGSNNKTY